jgi:hypothetical protein
MTIFGWAALAIGLVLYIAAFAKGAGPTMGDDPIQASLFTLATVLMIGGFLLLVVV